MALLVLGALTDYAAQARASLDGLRAALLARDSAHAERTAIVASLGRLQRRATVAATAADIVDELIRLPGHRRRRRAWRAAATTSMSWPSSAPPGSRRARASRCRERRPAISSSAAGPGRGPSARTRPNARGTYGQAMAESGVAGQAYAPWFDGGELVGIVAIGTCSPDDVAHLVADLPAVAEFAATAALLLTPMLAVERDRADARRTIGSIIAERAFHPVFQPVVELAAGRTVGFEALTRFDDGRRPDLVFREAARAGLGVELELATIEASLAAARDLPHGTWLSLNASPQLVVDAPGLVEVLARRDRPVVLEVTEHVPIEDYRAVRAAIERLGPGIRVAVDDAGAGIANFSHLVELWPRLVKVDAGLIRDLDRDLARQAAVVGFVHFAARAGSDVIAEGIETEAERRTAHELGVDARPGVPVRPARARRRRSPATWPPSARCRPGAARPRPRPRPRQLGGRSLPYSRPVSGRRLGGRQGRVAGQLAQAIDPVEDGRMGRHQARRALLELLDRVREVHVLRAAVGDLEHLRIARDLGQRPLEAVRDCGSAPRPTRRPGTRAGG